MSGGLLFKFREEWRACILACVCVNKLSIRERTEAPTQWGTVRSDKLVIQAWDDILISIYVLTFWPFLFTPMCECSNKLLIWWEEQE